MNIAKIRKIKLNYFKKKIKKIIIDIIILITTKKITQMKIIKKAISISILTEKINLKSVKMNIKI